MWKNKRSNPRNETLFFFGKQYKIRVLLLLSVFVLISAMTSCESSDNSPGYSDSDTDTDTDGDTDSDSDTSTDTSEGNADSDSDSDSDGDTGTGPEIDPDADLDGDGFTPNEGDCWDSGDDAEFINPDAIEDMGEDGLGDGVDNDCDGFTDGDDPELDPCDGGGLGDSAMNLVAAMDFCRPEFVLSASFDQSSDNYQDGLDTIEGQGSNDCILPQRGSEMAAISTGLVGQSDPNNATGMGGIMCTTSTANDPMPDYQGDSPTTSQIYTSGDRSQLRLTLKVPSNVLGFSFDFIFASAEYDEWVGDGFNDAFYAIMEYSSLNGGATTNISFDSNGSEIEVDTNFFENSSWPCDESGSGWEPSMPSVSGSTGWLQTVWDVEPNDEFEITFSIHDEGDCIYDSIVFLDNWVWYTQPVDPGTGEIDPPPPPV